MNEPKGIQYGVIATAKDFDGISNRTAVLEAAKYADCQECFYVYRVINRFCFRDQRWGGHCEERGDHEFVSLADFIKDLIQK